MGIDTDTNLHIVLLQNTINMTIHQLSIFIENKNGTLLRVLDILKEAKDIHDELETRYISEMDFGALDRLTDSLIKEMLG